MQLSIPPLLSFLPYLALLPLAVAAPVHPDVHLDIHPNVHPDLPVHPEEMNALLNFLPQSLRESITGGTGFAAASVQSFLLILATELADRTFFVAAILAMKSSRFTVWCGALTALAAMTVFSAAIGKAFPLLLDKRYTSIAAAALFLYFGIHLLREWWRMRGTEKLPNEELAEVEEELNHDDNGKKDGIRLAKLGLFSPVFVKALSMTALAEWGDRSQIATIALAASKDIYGVILGGVFGHAICTGLAVIGGRLLATKISERAVALMGGITFVAFSIMTAGGFLD